MPKKVFSRSVVKWLPFAIIIVVFSGLVYAAVQQNYRMTANDPQIQIAEDLSAAIVHGQPMEQIVPPQGTTELADSLSPFVMIYNATSSIVGSSVLLDGKNPSVPSGILDTAKASPNGEYRVTWQPKTGVRDALVVKYFTGTQSGYIVAGRSLKEIEIRENQTLLLSEVAGLVALVLTFIVILLFTNMAMKKKEMETMSEAKHPDNTSKPM